MNTEDVEKLETFEEIPLKAKPPRSSLGLNKRAIITTAAIGTLFVGYVILNSFNPASESSEAAAATKNYTNKAAGVMDLPDDYSQIKKKPTPMPSKKEVPMAMAKDFSIPKPSESEEEKLKKEYQLKKLKRLYEARDSSPQFSEGSAKVNEVRMERNSSQTLSSNEASFNASMPAESGISNLRDEANRQDDKNSFLKAERSEDNFLKSRLIGLISKYAVQAGTVIPGVLLTGINSDLPGQISGQVSQNVFDSKSGKYLLFPQGAKVIGEYDSRVVYGQERVLIVWTRIIFPNGKSINLEGMPGIDLSGYAGLSDKVNNHYLKIFTGVVLGSVLGASAQVANGNTRIGNPDFGELAISGAAQNINDAGQQITRKNLNIQPTIEIRPGYRFNIFVTKDISLELYEAE